mmetsp:Transcript_31542/g.30862  ORF Transcript_31542/g.30862 Transcript_31542/m.30862 type:complete len:161 (+) Transcript_31542:38-520(+)
MLGSEMFEKDSLNFNERLINDEEKKSNEVKVNKEFFGIKLKSGYTLMHLLAIPTVLISYNIIGTYVNTMLIFLLRNPAYFDIPPENLGLVTNSILFFAIIANMIATLFMGHIFDIFGRKKTLFINIMIASLFCTFLPMCSTIYPWLVVVRVVIAMSTTAG